MTDPDAIEPDAIEPDATPPGGDVGRTVLPKGDAPTTEFQVPEEYREKGWASKIKSEDDVYKQLDNLDSLAGKKTSVPDFATATDAEKEEYFSRTRPEDINSYEVPEKFTEADGKAYREAFSKRGILPAVAKDLLSDLVAHGEGISNTARSEEGFKEVMQGLFGEDYVEESKGASKLLQSHLSAENKVVFENMDNKSVGLVYQVAKDFMREYGASERSAPLAGGEGGIAQITEADIVAKMVEIQNVGTGINGATKKAQLTKEYDSMQTQFFKIKAKG